MSGKKTGVSMGGSIEYTRSKKTKSFIAKKDGQKNKRAKVCLNCVDNKEGFCSKFKNWCSKVNYICAGEANPYKNTIKPINKKTSKNISKDRVKQLVKKCGSCKYSNGSGHCIKFKKNTSSALVMCKTSYYKV